MKQNRDTESSILKHPLLQKIPLLRALAGRSAHADEFIEERKVPRPLPSACFTTG